MAYAMGCILTPLRGCPVQMRRGARRSFSGFDRDEILLPSAATVTTQLEDGFFQRAFQVTQLTNVEGIVSLAFDQEPGWRVFA
jgi:hypothetical protein